MYCESRAILTSRYFPLLLAVYNCHTGSNQRGTAHGSSARSSASLKRCAFASCDKSGHGMDHSCAIFQERPAEPTSSSRGRQVQSSKACGTARSHSPWALIPSQAAMDATYVAASPGMICHSRSQYISFCPIRHPSALLTIEKSYCDRPSLRCTQPSHRTIH